MAIGNVELTHECSPNPCFERAQNGKNEKYDTKEQLPKALVIMEKKVLAP